MISVQLIGEGAPAHTIDFADGVDVQIVQPGLFVVINNKGEQLGFFPIHAAGGVYFPDGRNTVVNVTGVSLV